MPVAWADMDIVYLTSLDDADQPRRISQSSCALHRSTSGVQCGRNDWFSYRNVNVLNLKDFNGADQPHRPPLWRPAGLCTANCKVSHGNATILWWKKVLLRSEITVFSWVMRQLSQMRDQYTPSLPGAPDSLEAGKVFHRLSILSWNHQCISVGTVVFLDQNIGLGGVCIQIYVGVPKLRTCAAASVRGYSPSWGVRTAGFQTHRHVDVFADDFYVLTSNIFKPSQCFSGARVSFHLVHWGHEILENSCKDLRSLHNGARCTFGSSLSLVWGICSVGIWPMTLADQELATTQALLALAREPPSDVVARVMLVRHAKGFQDKARGFGSVLHRDAALCAEGLAQAERLAANWSSSMHIADLVITSPFRCCLQTTAVSLGTSACHLPTVVQPLCAEQTLNRSALRRGDRGSTPGRLRRIFPLQDFPQYDFAAVDAYCEARGIAGGRWWVHQHGQWCESRASFGERCEAFRRWLVDECVCRGARRVVLVSHDSVLGVAFGWRHPAHCMPRAIDLFADGSFTFVHGASFGEDSLPDSDWSVMRTRIEIEGETLDASLVGASDAESVLEWGHPADEDWEDSSESSEISYIAGSCWKTKDTCSTCPCSADRSDVVVSALSAQTSRSWGTDGRWVRPAISCEL